MTIPHPNPYITLDQPTEAATTRGKRARKRRPLPPQETRDWMTANETALALGCSVATLHRLRRGVISGVEPLPCSQYGRKFVFRKPSIARWRDNNEQREMA
jgi:Helix-turn-helix domain